MKIESTADESYCRHISREQIKLPIIECGEKYSVYHREPAYAYEK